MFIALNKLIKKSGAAAGSAISYVNENILISGKQNKGIMDLSTGTFTWSDLKGHFIVDKSGANAPTIEEWKTGVFGLGYNATDKQHVNMHVEHSDRVGGDKFLHAHVRQNGTASGSDFSATAVISHNFGHGRAGSPAPLTKTITITAAELVQHSTIIPDILIMQSGGGAGLLDSDDILPDDDIMVTLTIDTIPTISGGLSSKVFVPFVDIHREVIDGSGTTNKEPNFYSV